MSLCPHLYVRADAASGIGAGHFLRCRALADAWIERGGGATFLSNCESEALRSQLEAARIGFFPVNRPHPDYADLESTLAFLQKSKGERCESRPWVVLDGYHFDTAYQEKIRKAGFRLLVIDDNNHLPFYEADALLNQNIHSGKKFVYRCGAGTKLLLGLAYTLLRPEFRRLAGKVRTIPPVAGKILLTMGGSDPDNFTVKVIEALEGVDLADLDAAVVVGPANRHRAVIEEKIRISRKRTALRLLAAPGNMAELMRWADMAVSAAGSTCWELLLMGLPSLVVILAENQRIVAEGLASDGVSVNLGRHDEVSAEKIARSILDLARDPAKRARMSSAGRALIDGDGANRVVDCLRSSL